MLRFFRANKSPTWYWYVSRPGPWTFPFFLEGTGTGIVKIPTSEPGEMSAASLAAPNVSLGRD